MDENNNQNIPGSFDNNDIFNTPPANNASNPYEPFENTMPYERNNNFTDNAQVNQDNNFGDVDLFNLDNNMQYNQGNSFDNNMQYGQDNNFDNNIQYGQDNNFDNNMQYGQDNTQFVQADSYNNNAQYSQDNNYDNNMQYNSQNSYDNNMQYSQDNTQYAQNNYDYNNSNINSNSYTDDTGYATDFAKAWMGNIYDKAQSKKFNWCSAFFGGIYFMYRKMYLSGLLFIILSNLTYLIPSLMFFNGIIKSIALYGVLAIALPLIFVVIFGFAFYPLYKSSINSKLNKLKSTITDNSTIINVATQKGGTSALGVVLGIIVSAIISAVGLGTTIANSMEKLFSKLPNESQPSEVTNEIVEPTTDMKSFNFLNEYSIEYDSLSWFLNPIDNTLTKGNYKFIYSGQYVDDITNNLGVDVTTNVGRSNLLHNLISSLESQAAAVNLSVEVGTNTFVADDNSYYAYIDVISDSDISRYYLALLPEKDILFQFVLSTNDTTIDYTTNLEVINILTSIYTADSNDPADENEDSNTISNEISNVVSNSVDNSISNEVGVTSSNTISNEVTNNVSNSIIENTTSNNNQVPLQSLLH